MTLPETLNELGLSKNKHQVYLAALQLGQASVQEIANKADLQRTTTHQIIKQLSKMGLIKINLSKKKYSVQNPQKLIKIIEQKKLMLNSVFLQLTSLYHQSGKRPIIKYFEGMIGLQEIWEDTIIIGEKTFYEIGPISGRYGVYNTFDKEYIKDYIQRRVANKIAIKVLRTKELSKEDFFKGSVNELRETRYVNQNFPLKATLLVYDNKVAIIDTIKGIYGLIIESADFHNTIKNIFDTVWQYSQIDGYIMK